MHDHDLACHYSDEVKNVLGQAVSLDTRVQSEMGCRYAQGEGVPKDGSVAVKAGLTSTTGGACPSDHTPINP